MTTWLNPTASRPKTEPGAGKRTDRALRRMDFALAVLALLVLAAPLALGLGVGRLRGLKTVGRHGHLFQRWVLELPATLVGRCLRWTGMSAWPVLYNVLAGHMAWVGHRPIPADLDGDYHPSLAALRPGLVSIWRLRQRTAVDFDSEIQCDLEYLAQRGCRHDLGLLLRAALVGWMGAPRAAARGRVRVGDVSFDNVDMQEAVRLVSDMLDGATVQQVSFVNPACVNIAAGDRGYRRILARAALVLPDGIGIKIAADLIGAPLKQNVNGTDLFPRLCAMLEARGASLFLLGGHPGVADRVASVVREKWPRLRLVGVRDGFFGVAQEGEVAAQVRASGADVLLVARGVPMQDVFIDRHLHQLGVKVAMGVGGLFDFVSGRIDRAPAWMRDSGMEWIYRLMQEPQRMWRRYLLGNFTFLGRIALQRLGLRQPALDLQHQMAAKPAPAGGAAQSARVVLFATATAPVDVPVPEGFSAALLPLGCSTFIERNLDQLAGAGVRRIDLVVSGRPEELRVRLGGGERWGIDLRWHLAKDASKPYGMLKALGLNQSGRMLVGHADRCIGTAALDALLQRNLIAVRAVDTDGIRWSGWGSADAAALAAVPPHCEEGELGLFACRVTSARLLLAPGQFAGALNAGELLQVQQDMLAGASFGAIPATWIRTAWGAMSPDAYVHPQARIEGPTWVGPGCFVAASARIGPGTILTQDVAVSAGCSIRHSIVLPHTFVGHGLALDQAVVHANAVQHLRWGVRTVMPASEGLLLDLQPAARPAGSWVGRALAGLACLVVLPWLLADTVLRRMRGLPLRWRERKVVTGQDRVSGQLRLRTLRCARSSESGAGRMLAQYGACLDVLAGRRSWFGARPRSASEWYALGRDWQLLLADAPIGCLHAPAWSDGKEEPLEARAAADVFFAVQRSAAQALRLVLAEFRRAGLGNGAVRA